MSKRIKIKKFDLEIEIYRSNILVVFTDDVEAYLKKVDEWDEEADDSVAFTWEINDDGFYVATVILPFNCDLCDLIHEGSHAATIIAGIVGVLPTREEDEAYAYLTEFIVMKLIALKKKASKRK